MEQKSQAQSIADQLAAKIGTLELEKAIVVAQLEAKIYECDMHKAEIENLKIQKGEGA